MGSHTIIKPSGGLHFTVTTLPNELEVIYDPNSMRYSGLCMNILDALAMSMNFTYDVIVPHDKEYGVQMANGSWSGMMHA